MSHDPHTGFIVAAFAVTFVAIAGTVVAIVVDHARLRRRLAGLQAQLPAGDEEDRR